MRLGAKQKAKPVQWLKKVRNWPCVGNNCSGGGGCNRDELLVRVKLKKGGYAWSAQVFCICPAPVSVTGARVFHCTPVAEKQTAKTAKANGARKVVARGKR